MGDKILYEGTWLSIVERDGWYQFSRETARAGVVYVLVFRKAVFHPVLGRYEICPAHGDAEPILTSLSGGIEVGQDPADAAVAEVYEEAGYRITRDQLIDLGKVNLTKSTDTIGYLYAVDVSDLERGDAPGDGSLGEEKSYCNWVSEDAALMCKCPVMATLIIRAGNGGMLGGQWALPTSWLHAAGRAWDSVMKGTA